LSVAKKIECSEIRASLPFFWWPVATGNFGSNNDFSVLGKKLLTLEYIEFSELYGPSVRCQWLLKVWGFCNFYDNNSKNDMMLLLENTQLPRWEGA
jgi:hypothetical protein